MLKTFQGGSGMKKVLIMILLAGLLTGCAAQETFETVDDGIKAEAVVSPQQFFVILPEEAAVPTCQDDGGELYVCQDYTISKQILQSGDLEKTVQTLTGKSAEELEIIHTTQSNWDRYDFVWTAAGEEGLQLGRACILDDGNYHYALSTMTGEEAASDLREVQEDMFASCALLDADLNLRTAS